MVSGEEGETTAAGLQVPELHEKGKQSTPRSDHAGSVFLPFFSELMLCGACERVRGRISGTWGLWRVDR